MGGILQLKMDLLLHKTYYYFLLFLGAYISLKRNQIKKVKEQWIPGATEISPSCSAAVYRMVREDITQNAI